MATTNANFKVKNGLDAGGNISTTSGLVAGTATLPANMQAYLLSTVATNVGLTVRGASGQTADLQQWHNSAGTVLSYVEAGGSFFIGGSGTLISAISGRAAFVTNSASAVPLLVKGAASQTADLLQIQNSASTILSGFDSGGKLYLGASNPTGATIHASTGNAARVGQVIQAVASQTADLFQVRNSSSGVLTNIDANGVVNINNASLRVNTIGASYGARIQLNTDGTGVIGQVIRGTASQTADLQQWQSSTGTILSLVNSAGSFRVASIGAIASGNAALTPGGDTNGFLLATVNAGNKGLSIRGAASQTANLQEWQTNTPTTVASVSATGLFTNAADIVTGGDLKFSSTGTGAPTFTTYSAGVRTIHYDNVGATSVGYTTGIDAGVLWNSIPAADAGQSFKWYGGTTVLATLTGAGALTTTGSITASGSFNTPSTSFDLINTNATTVNAFGAATTMNIGTAANEVTIGNSGTLGTGTQTVSLFTGSSTTGTTQNINIGTGAFSLATQNINIGTNATSGLTATRTINIGTSASTGATTTTTINGTLVASLGKKVIQTIALSGTSAIAFTSIPAGYRDLEIRILATTAVTTSGTLTLTVNGLTTNIYNTVHQYVNGVSPGTITYTQQSAATSANLTASTFGATASSALTYRLYDYTSGSFKTGNITWMGGPSSGTYFHGTGALFIKSTAAITQINIAVGGTGGITGSAVLIGVY